MINRENEVGRAAPLPEIASSRFRKSSVKKSSYCDSALLAMTQDDALFHSLYLSPGHCEERDATNLVHIILTHRASRADELAFVLLYP